MSSFKFAKLLEKRGVANCIECFSKMNCYNYDIGISGEERGDSVKDRHNCCCGWAGWLKGILILEGERGGWFEKSWIEKAANYSFYHAMRMHSMDYAIARCPSVCHTPILCLNGYLYLQFFPLSGSPTILVFSYQTRWQYSDGDSPNEDIECKGYEKITIFDQCLALSRNWCQTEP